MIAGGASPVRCETARDVASISSRVAHCEPTRSGTALVAATTVGNTSRPVATCGCTGTVRRVALATNPRVPSEPIMRCSRMATGSSWSRNEFSP